MKSISRWVMVLVLVAVLVLVVAAGGSALFKARNNTAASVTNTQEALSSAFCDGAYLGKLAAERGDAPHVSIGRWWTDADRKLFSAGYEKGYSEEIARIHPAREDQADTESVLAN
ncbi:MAG: hypothetical protein WB919_18945 [Candidatus Sulfotelmatobacter sp.]